MIINLPMLVNLQATFAMLLFCYAKWLIYLQHIIFPSLSILQHYTKFDACTIAMLEKLLRIGFFDNIWPIVKSFFVLLQGG
jgi:hypothetical protein